MEEPDIMILESQKALSVLIQQRNLLAHKKPLTEVQELADELPYLDERVRKNVFNGFEQLSDKVKEALEPILKESESFVLLLQLAKEYYKYIILIDFIINYYFNPEI